MTILDFSVSGLCRWHGFQSISQVCFGISIKNFIWMLMVAIGSRLLIFSDVNYKMATWWPYWFFGFQTPIVVWLWIWTRNFSGPILVYMGRSLLIFSDCHFQNGHLSCPNFSVTLLVCVGRFLRFWTMFNCNPPIAHCYPLLRAGVS